MKPEMEGKKLYEAPEFIHWGSLEALTAGDQGGNGDGEETGDDDPGS